MMAATLEVPLALILSLGTDSQAMVNLVMANLAMANQVTVPQVTVSLVMANLTMASKIADSLGTDSQPTANQAILNQATLSQDMAPQVMVNQVTVLQAIPAQATGMALPDTIRPTAPTQRVVKRRKVIKRACSWVLPVAWPSEPLVELSLPTPCVSLLPPSMPLR